MDPSGGQPEAEVCGTNRQVGENSGRFGTVRQLQVSPGVQATALQHTDTHTVAHS